MWLLWEQRIMVMFIYQRAIFKWMMPILDYRHNKLYR